MRAGEVVGRLVLLMALVGLFLGGCAKKAPDSVYDGTETDDGVGETDLGEGRGIAPGSSLDEFRRGTLGTGGYGPLDDVFFGFDSYAVDDNAREILRLNGDWLGANPAVRIEIEGHTDSRGTEEYNLALGARRATSVRDYLVSLGIPAGRLTTISYGKELPVCRDETESCWAENRRVHFVVLD